MPSETISHGAITRRGAAVAISAAIGVLLLTAHPVAIALTCFLPALWLRQRDRCSAYLCACFYYGGAIWPVISIVHRFDGSWFFGTCIWGGAFVALSLPWLTFHSSKPNRAFWCGVLALIISVMPPLGLIGVACPLSCAGFLFPACKVAGLFAACILPGLLAWKPKPAILLASAAVLFANVHYAAAGPPRCLDWEGIDTVADHTPGAFGDFQRVEAMLDRAESSRARVIVFPEATIRSWTPTTLTFFDDRVRSLREKGKTLVTGVLIPEPYGYRNVVEAFGATTALFEQRVPVPLGMWNPFGRSGVSLKPYGNGVGRIQNQRAAILICYEQLIAWPAIASSFSVPGVAVGIGDDTSVSGTAVPRLKSVYLQAWARLWNVPLVTAEAK